MKRISKRQIGKRYLFFARKLTIPGFFLDRPFKARYTKFAIGLRRKGAGANGSCKKNLCGEKVSLCSSGKVAARRAKKLSGLEKFDRRPGADPV